jgi:hypothetical protein
MFGIDDALMIGGAASFLGGLFSANKTNKTNPNQFAYGLGQQYQQQANQFLDPNNSFYKNAQSQYFGNLNRTMNASSPGTQSLLTMAMAQGGNYGGSSYIAGKQREQITQKNTDAAGQSANQFGQGLYQQGLGAYEQEQGLSAQMYNLFGQGAMQENQNQASFSNELMGLGGGLMGQYLENMNPNPYSYSPRAKGARRTNG